MDPPGLPFGPPLDLIPPPGLKLLGHFTSWKRACGGVFLIFWPFFHFLGGILLILDPQLTNFDGRTTWGPRIGLEPPLWMAERLGPDFQTWVGYQGRKSIGLRFGPPPIGEKLTRPPWAFSDQFSINFRWPNDLGARLRVLVPDLESSFWTNRGGPDPF